MITKDKLLNEDLRLWDGVERNASRRDSYGGVLVGSKVGNYVDVLTVYGQSTGLTGITISSALSSVGTKVVTFIFTPGIWQINSNITIPSNIVSRVPAGVTFVVASGKTLTFDGPIIQDHPTWYSGSVTVNSGRTISGDLTVIGDITVNDATVGGDLSVAGAATIDGDYIYRATGTDVPVTDGGTGASTAAGARVNLSVDGITMLDTSELIYSGSGAKSATTVSNSTLASASAKCAILKCRVLVAIDSDVLSGAYVRCYKTGTSPDAGHDVAHAYVYGQSNTTGFIQTQDSGLGIVNLDSNYDFNYLVGLTGSPAATASIYLVGYVA